MTELNSADDDSADLVCDKCGAAYRGDPARPDPYASEIYSDDAPRPLCDACWDEAADDI